VEGSYRFRGVGPGLWRSLSREQGEPRITARCGREEISTHLAMRRTMHHFQQQTNYSRLWTLLNAAGYKKENLERSYARGRESNAAVVE